MIIRPRPKGGRWDSKSDHCELRIEEPSNVSLLLI